MKDKLRSHFLSLGPRRFVAAAVLSLILTDILNCLYLKNYWVNKDISLNLVHQTILKSGQTVEDFSSITIQEMSGFVDNSFYFILFVIMVNNLFFYLFYLRKKLWAQGFVLFYALTGALLQFVFIFDHAGMSFGWLAYNVITIPYYLYIFLGVKFLKPETTLTIPKIEKRGR